MKSRNASKYEVQQIFNCRIGDCTITFSRGLDFFKRAFGIRLRFN